MISYVRFQWELLEIYGYNSDLFWQEQYAMWQNGYRGVKLHDITYDLLGSL